MAPILIMATNRGITRYIYFILTMAEILFFKELQNCKLKKMSTIVQPIFKQVNCLCPCRECTFPVSLVMVEVKLR